MKKERREGLAGFEAIKMERRERQAGYGVMKEEKEWKDRQDME